jgi:hypothetical protein
VSVAHGKTRALRNSKCIDPVRVVRGCGAVTGPAVSSVTLRNQTAFARNASRPPLMASGSMGGAVIEEGHPCPAVPSVGTPRPRESMIAFITRWALSANTTASRVRLRLLSSRERPRRAGFGAVQLPRPVEHCPCTLRRHPGTWPRDRQSSADIRRPANLVSGRVHGCRHGGPAGLVRAPPVTGHRYAEDRPVFSSKPVPVIAYPARWMLLRMIAPTTTAGGQAVASGTGGLGDVGESARKNLNRYP